MTDRLDTAAREPMAHRAAQELTHRLFHGLPRADQRRWAGAYLTGLLATPGKKSVRNMGWAVCASYTASQSLHQAVNESTWSWTDVRAELTAWCRERTEVRGWALGRVTLPKRGRYSAGVHRRFDTAAGRTLNCQLGVGLFLLTGHGAAVPVDWRLHLPDEWLGDASLRRRARIPDTVRAGSPGRMMVELAATAGRSGGPGSFGGPGGSGAPVVADAETVQEAAELIEGFTALGVDWAVSVPAATPVLAGLSPAARRPGHRPAGAVAVTAGALARQLRGSARALGAGEPDGPHLLPALVHTPEAARPLRLVAAWAPGARAPRRLWLTSLHGQRLTEAAGLFRPQAVDPAALAGLDDCGLRDFEGRSYPGWHRHMTLVSAAYGHRVLGPADARRPVERAEVRAA
ncbi:IS701 family transposase [Streptomyces gobitricini]|uniref:Transposase n=1 Tax=Streptomyces gobitricini TaxID=68211 RepID=A0ABN3LDX0_9ACTN